MATPVQVLPMVHEGPWTIEDWLVLPETVGQQCELVDGALVMSPNPAPRHQRLLHRFVVALDAAAPPELEVLIGINVQMGADRALIPDLAVVDCPGFEQVMIGVEHLVLAVEIVSPTSRTHDRVTKRQLYAEAGVPHYVVIDSTAHPPTALAYRLEQGEYREESRAEGGVPLRLAAPFPVTLDLTEPAQG